MQLAPSLARQLRLLGSDAGDGLDLAGGLVRLSGDLQRAVPSLSAVLLVVTRLDVRVPIAVVAPRAAASPPRASLAVPLPGAAGAAAQDHGLLVLQAEEPGAFLLLVDQLGTGAGRAGPQPELDQHLDVVIGPTGDALAAALADLSSAEQALGVLIGRGMVAPDAADELRRQARAAGISVSQAGRLLLQGLGGSDGAS